MKVLQVSDARGWSGGTQQVLLLCEELRNKGAKVTLVTNTESELQKRGTKSGLRIVPLRMRQDYDLAAVWQLRKLILKEKFDLIHAHHSTAHAISLLAAKLSGIPSLVVTRRVIFGIKNNPFSKWKYCSPRISKFIAVCSQIKSLLSKYGVDQDRVAVIPSAVDLERFQPVCDKAEARQKWGIAPTEMVIGTVGNNGWFKGYPYLMQAAEVVSHKHPEARFFFCGKGTEELSKLARELQIESKVILSGFRNDIPQILSCFDTFVLPSLQEGIATAGIEAMASGLPVVGTQVGGIPDIVTEKSGMLVPPANPQALADAILHLIERPQLREQMGKEGRALAEQKFSKEKVTAEILELYRTSLNGSS